MQNCSIGSTGKRALIQSEPMRLGAAFCSVLLGWWVFVGALVGVAGAEDGASKLRAAGMAAYRAGDYGEAKKAFDQAFRIAPLHSVGLWSARARVKLGEWVEAEERYERLTKTPITRGERGAEEEARQLAVREREDLRHRLPRLRIRLEGLEGEPVEVAIDGAPVSQEYLLVKAKRRGIFPHGKALAVNPGDHLIVGVTGEQRKEVSLSIAEGETRDVSLRFVNPDTLRQRKCADRCRQDCGTKNRCYVDCKHRCFTERD